MFLKTEKHKNGDFYTLVEVYECDRCHEEVSEMHPRYEDQEKDIHFCWHCGFIEGEISEDQFLRHCGVGLNNMHAAVNPDGQIEIWTGENATPPWERPAKDQRSTPQYRRWRESVFERDDYTCQHCGERGGDLNAHHIKPYAKFKDLRFSVSNGLTLCVDCHRKVHKEG